MKKIFLFLSLMMIVGLAFNAHAEEKVCPDPNCDDPVSQYAQNYLDKMKKIWDDALNQAGNINYDALEDCLNTAEKKINLDETVNRSILDFAMPKINELIGYACKAVVNEIGKQINKLDSTLADLIPWNGKIDFNDFSKDIAGEVLDNVFDKTGNWGDLNNFPKSTTVNDKLSGITNDL